MQEGVWGGGGGGIKGFIIYSVIPRFWVIRGPLRGVGGMC